MCVLGSSISLPFRFRFASWSHHEAGWRQCQYPIFRDSRGARVDCGKHERKLPQIGGKPDCYATDWRLGKRLRGFALSHAGAYACMRAGAGIGVAALPG